MANEILINGQTTDCVPFQDRGLHYGDGLFETVAVNKGQLLCWADHLERLLVSCQRLAIPFTAMPQLTEEAEQLAENCERAVIKIMVTRGQGGRGYAPPAAPEPTRIVARYPWPAFPAVMVDNGIEVRIGQTRYGHQPQLAGIKHLNRLEQVLARAEWDDPSISEGIVLDIDDNVIEGTMSNLFYMRNGRLFTPDLGQCGINGVIRQKILDITGNVQVVTTKMPDLIAAEEIFVCNSIIGLWPVTRLNQQHFAIGSATLQLKQLLIKQQFICP